MKMEEEKKLTNKQRIFCEEYIMDWNATRAAKVAGYSEKTAQQMGYENLTKPLIQEYIEEIQKDLKKLAGISPLGLLAELKSIAEDSDYDDIQARDKMKAIEIINKMLGFNAPEKTESKNAHTHKGIEPITWVNDSTK